MKKTVRHSLSALLFSSCLSLLTSGLSASAQVPYSTRWPEQTSSRSAETRAVNTPSSAPIRIASPQPLRQYERVYVSTSGEFLGAETVFGGSVLFIDRSGEVNVAIRDYTADLDYDYTGRLNRIGAANISYDYRGRVEQIGSSAIDYDFRSRIGQIDTDAITYTPRGQVSQVGTVTIQYDSDAIETISSNYTNSGTRIVIVGHH